MDIRVQKIRLWLKNPPEMKFPEPLNLPKFSKQTFRNYEEMNAWKQEYLKRIAKQGGIKWKILKKLNEAGARYVVIGGQAMLQEGMPRFTLDWDLFVPSRDSENFEKINRALSDELDMELIPFDPLTGEGFVQTYQTSLGIIQFHQTLPGLPKFDIVEARSVSHEYHGVSAKYLCLDDLLASKLAVARDKDSDDILFLQMKKESFSHGPEND